MSEPRDPSTDAAPPPAPRVIGERYRLGAVIGRGGMATVHRATDIRLDREVAVKLLKPEVTADADLAQRFRREALAATVLRHPNIVACLDTGTDGDQPYLVMELVDGEDLAARLRRGGRLAPWAAARIGLDVARALGVAHVRGIVHRDIKPGNILLAADGRAMVTDFGIARLAMDAEAAAPGTTLGSVHYFSPEQARGVATTPASDVYGLGLVLYEAVTGERPWAGDTTDAIALARVGKTAADVRERRPEIPAALAAIVARALSPDPADRFPNGGAMAAALEPIVAGGDAAMASAAGSVTGVATDAPDDRPTASDVAPPLTPDHAAPAAAPASSVVFRGRAVAPRRGPSVGLVAAAVAVIAVIGGGLLLGALPNGGDAIDPSPPAETEDPVANVTPEPPATPEPTPTEAVTPTPDPTPEPTPVPDGEVADLCEPFFDLACGLGAGRYLPSRFDAPFDVELGDGWSTLAHADDVVALTREEGLMTYLTGLQTIEPEGDARDAPDDARGVIEAVVTMDGVAASEPAPVTIDERTGFSTDCSPIDGNRIALFATAASTYYLEPGRTSRIVALDTPDGVVILAIESYGDFTLRQILDTADPAAGTMRWR